MRLAVNFSEPNSRTLNFEFSPSFFSLLLFSHPPRHAGVLRDLFSVDVHVILYCYYIIILPFGPESL